MITIFHGTDIAASRNAFVARRKESSNVQSFDGIKLDLLSLRQAIEGGGLFDSDQTIVVEELLSKRKASKELDSLLAYIAENQNHDMLFWESKELTPKQLGNFPSAKVLKYTLPTVLFTFLETLRPQNAQHMLRLFHEVLETQDVEMIFFMIVRQIRLLLSFRDEGISVIDEVIRLAPWQKGKVQKQAQQFSKEQLCTFYQNLFSLEYAMKTGKLIQPLEAELDTLLIRL